MHAIWDKSEKGWVTRQETHTFYSMVLVFEERSGALKIKRDLYPSRNFGVRPVEIVEK
jgi:hypothetical protein